MKTTADIKAELSGKRLLALGGSLWCDAIKKVIDTYDITLIATGNNHSGELFEIATEKYFVDSTDSTAMKQLIQDKKIDGVYMGGSEAVISSACEYINDLGLPCYCTKDQWDNLQDKERFKSLCLKHGLPVVQKFEISDLDALPPIPFPVITKPTDGCGSSGFSICHNNDELKIGYKKAQTNSPTQSVIVEKFVKNDGVVVFYTLSNGVLHFSGLEDKYPVKYKQYDSYVGGLFVFESYLTSEFRTKFEAKIASLIKELNIKEGSFWIEVFYDGIHYYFNEVGFRYGGSASLYPINYIHGINQVASDIYYALTGKGQIDNFISIIPDHVPAKKYYAVYPIYSHAGVVSKIHGLNKMKQDDHVVAFPLKIAVGNTVHASGTFSQVIALAHLVFDEKDELVALIDKIHENFKVLDENSHNMIYRMLNLDTLILKTGEKEC